MAICLHALMFNLTPIHRTLAFCITLRNRSDVHSCIGCPTSLGCLSPVRLLSNKLPDLDCSLGCGCSHGCSLDYGCSHGCSLDGYCVYHLTCLSIHALVRSIGGDQPSYCLPTKMDCCIAHPWSGIATFHKTAILTTNNKPITLQSPVANIGG
jgi:hypothetical protein